MCWLCLVAYGTLVLPPGTEPMPPTLEAWTLNHSGFKTMPVITGQDNTAMAQNNIKLSKQAMTIDKNLNDMAYNTAMIINSLIAGAPVQSSHSISVGSVTIPVFYSKNTLITIDSL